MNTLLIANRGEIARRVIRTARRLGWRTVAIHSDLDAGALHVREADDAVRVESYLDVDEVVAAAREAGAGFVHPGYGFLSERAPFARALAEAGITLVGPSAEVMDAMGRKDAAREVAVAAGVPVVPSYDLDDDPAGFAYPVLVKAAAGGGGKGMRVVRSAADYAEGFAAAQREARSAFGDDTILVEKYVESGRHIEVQVMGDTHGHVVHLFERDCSTQRRHQKVLEEAPAPAITEEQRAAITGAAVALAAQCGYTGAGTVEFLLDNATGEFYFLEMNTRLQVEHPVTEEVVRVRGQRVDLVELQLRVATGQPLGIDQADVTLEGHAIEARVYAEDSFGGFLPQAGRAGEVRWPGGDRVRVDHSLVSGQQVSTAYDPMLGKVVAGGTDREDARRRLVAALDDTVVLGLTTNTGFLRALADHAAFRDVGHEGGLDTAWLDRVDVATEVPAPSTDEARHLAAWAVHLAESETTGPFASDGFRLGAPPAPVVVPLDEDVVLGRRPRLDPAAHVTPASVEVVLRGQRFRFERGDLAGDHADEHTGDLVAPMPGTVLDVRVEAGGIVEEGQVLGVLEAMKMELALKAPYAGTVTVVDATVGRQVPLGHVLFHVEPTGQEGQE